MTEQKAPELGRVKTDTKTVTSFANYCYENLPPAAGFTAAQMFYALTAERDALAAEVERLRGALTVYSDKVSEYAHEDPAISDLAYDWLNEDGGNLARAALKEGKD